MLEGVVVGRQKRNPTLNPWIMFADLGHVLQGAVVGENAELGAAEVAAEAFDCPNHSSSFEVERRPVSLGVESCSADENDGLDAAVRLLLLECSSEAVDASVTVKTERSGLIFDGCPVGEHEDRRTGKFLEKLADCGFHFAGENEWSAFFK